MTAAATALLKLAHEFNTDPRALGQFLLRQRTPPQQPGEPLSDTATAANNA